MVPKFYHKYLHVFDKAEGEALPPHRPWDCKIKLAQEAELRSTKLYNMSQRELDILKPYIEEQVKKGYIAKSESPIAVPMFFVPKKDGTSRPVVDYCRLNKIPMKDKYLILLTGQLVDCLQGAKYFMKLDL
jgi:hypothetical protein